jgi:hypothetical protein
MIFFEIPIVYILVVIAIILGLVFVGFVGLVYWIQAHLTAIIIVIGIINLILIVGCGLLWLYAKKISPEINGFIEFFKGAMLGLAASAILDIPLFLIYHIFMWIADMLGMF